MENSIINNQDQLWDKLIDLRDKLEVDEAENQDLLEQLFFILDNMRGGHDVTEAMLEEIAFLEEVSFILKQWRGEQDVTEQVETFLNKPFVKKLSQ